MRFPRLPLRPRTIVLLVMVVVILSLLYLPFSGILMRQETRLVQLTEAPHDIVRDKDSLQLSGDVMSFSRTGTNLVKNNTSGVMEKVWDNGTFVKDIEDGSVIQIHDEVLEAQISNNMIVWREGDAIVLLNAFTGTRKLLPTPGSKPVSRPDIHENLVVWADGRSDLDLHDDVTMIEIYLFDTTTETETKVTTNVSNKGAPSVWGDLVVWADDRNGDFDIYSYNVTTHNETRITFDENGQYEPKASSRAIVWIDTRTSTYEWKEDLFYLDLETGEERQASESGEVESFDVWGHRIVWEDLSLKNRPLEKGDILIHNINKNRTRSYFASEWGQWSPSISGQRIIWVDGSREGGEVFIRERIERPIFGFDELTLWAILVAGLVALTVFGLFRYSLWIEKKDLQRFTRKRGLKRGMRPKEREPPGRKKEKKKGRRRRRRPPGPGGPNLTRGRRTGSSRRRQ